jgi:excisionase family DNA binding protein
MPQTTPAPSLLDVPAAAAYLGVSERWMRRAVAERRLPHVKCGRLVRFEPAELDAYIDRQRVPAVGAA